VDNEESRGNRQTRPVTLMDVAQLAGVSQSAVSRTFTPGASVAEATRHKVLEAARKLGYRPNAIARTLMTRRSRMIAVVVSYLQNQFYPVVIELLSQALQRHGYHVLLFVSDGHEAGRSEVDDMLLDVMQYQVDGIVLASATMSAGLARDCQAAGVPVVLFNRAAPIANASTVVSDNIGGGRLAARVLVESGCKRVAYVAGLEVSSTSRDREQGFREQLAEMGQGIYARSIGNYSFSVACAATRELFSQRQPPDGIFAANDHTAFAVIDTLRLELGWRVPEDIAVIGFDNVPQAAWGGYRLTTIEQDASSMVDATVAILLEQLESGLHGQGQHVVTPVRLVQRATTRTAQ
jgi:DNA-binding LacI/PurR family transcriptional regulator